MRVLLAIDGSPSSDVARALVGSLDWPEGTCIRVVSVVEPTMSFTSLSPLAVATADEPGLTAALRATLDATVASLAADGRGVEGRLLRGRPASTIVEEAEAFRAELLVVGSRGLGPLSTMVLGSVSAELVDHAPCPVLVARRPSVDRVLMAVDGSVGAKQAVEHLGGTGYLAKPAVEVLSVAARVVASSASMALYALSAPPDEGEAGAVRRTWAEDAAATAAADLRRAGLDARWSISTGIAAQEIIEAAASLDCNLIVMGSRGHSGLQRILLGSVARNVLLHTRASVLIVKEPLRERLPERIAAGVPQRAVAAAG